MIPVLLIFAMLIAVIWGALTLTATGILLNFLLKRRFDEAGRILRDHKGVIPRPPSLTTIVIHSTVVFVAILAWLAAFDILLCRYDQRVTRSSVVDFFTRFKHDKRSSYKLWSVPDGPFKGKVDDNGIIQNAGVTIKDPVWTPKGWPDDGKWTWSNSSELPNRILRAVSLNEQWTSWATEFFFTSTQPRSVFTAVNQLSERRQEYPNWAFEYAMLLASPEDMDDIARLKKDDPVPRFTPRHFDSIRERLLRADQKTIDLIRVNYTGLLNHAIFAVAAVCFTIVRANHVLFKKRCDYQEPKRGDRNAGTSLIPSDHPRNLDWPTFWSVKDFGRLSSSIRLSHQDATNEGSDPGLVLSLCYRLLTRLKQLRPLWIDGIKRQVIYETVDDFQRQAIDEGIELSPSNGEEPKSFPELMTTLGFLGTIIGIILGMSAAAQTQVPSEDSLYRSMSIGEMLSGLSVSYSTTLIGILCALFLKTWTGRCIKIEIDLVRACTTAVGNEFRNHYDEIFSRDENDGDSE
jgi:hypothetical protein